jgi:FAD/FMN-containing dehydrogenase
MSTQATLDSKFAGELISPDHPRNDEARKLFNGMIDKRPARLVALKDKYDPDNVFSLNQNIPPSNGA